MATDKTPLPDADDDIIDLTDLVEEGADHATSGADGPVDMSFEQELEDLFGDAEPSSPKAAAPATAAAEDEDLIDLSGLGLDDEAPAPPAGPADADDDDIVDLAGLGFDEESTDKVEAEIDRDLANLGLGDPAPEAPRAPAAPDEDFPDMAGGGLDEAPEPVARAAAPVSEDEALADLFAVAPEPAAAQAGTAAPDDASMDLAAMDLGDLAPQADDAAAPPAMADVLGQLPDEAPDIGQLSGIDTLSPPAAPLLDTAGAVGAAALAAVAVAATAVSTSPEPPARVGAIDLGALDNLIDAAKGPPPEPEAEEPTAKARLDALASRLDTLETTTATLLDKLEAQTATDGDTLANALSARLEDALSERLEAVLSGLPAAPDLAGLRAEITAELDTRAVKDRTRLLADLAQTLDKRFEALAEDLAKGGQAAPAEGLAELGQALSRLEARAAEGEAAFKDFAGTVETRLAELRRELPQPGEFATQAGLDEGLETLRETLARDIAGSLDERLGELRRELREALAGDIAASLDERLGELRRELRQAQAADLAAALDERQAGLAEAARAAAREEMQALGEVLSGRIEALEADRLDPDALREELTASLEKTVPRVAAAVIREEIAALAKEFM
ncbi:hypothetical protein [Solidesulfovibrio sp.]|uniref:hypothetical protein n=1 Tax=Solidesulfovibrio sp. TaxID=2910990 RepID=UPI002B1F4973|nr:hypothetical protein [Solidesulfovibrio sp.]MEA4856374.1 hypothetical protein [Solidesulfovibrio sp.]